MKLIQRLGNDITEEYVNSYIEYITKYKGSCAEVWFATSYGFPSLEKHKENAEKRGLSVENFDVLRFFHHTRFKYYRHFTFLGCRSCT